MIAARGLAPLNALAFVDPARIFAVESGSCSLPYPRRYRSTNPSVKSIRTPNLLQCSANRRSKLCRNGRSPQCCEFSSSIFGSGLLESFKDDRHSTRRSSKGLGIGCNHCRDHHHHHSPDEEDYCEPSCHKKEGCPFKQHRPPKECSEPAAEDSESGDADQVLLFSLSILSSLALWLYGHSQFRSKPVMVLCVVKGQKNLAALVQRQKKTRKPSLTATHDDNVFLCCLPILSFFTICLYSLSHYLIEPRTCSASAGGGNMSCTIRAREEFTRSLFTKLSSRIFKELPAEFLYQFVNSLVEEETKADEP